jgi:hypothetical protein
MQKIIQYSNPVLNNKVQSNPRQSKPLKLAIIKAKVEGLAVN